MSKYRTHTYKIKERGDIVSKVDTYLNACRFVYNLGKEIKSYTYSAFGRSVSNYELQKQLTQLKKEEGWLKETPSQTLQWALEKLDSSYQKFFKGGGYPKWASKKKFRTVCFKSIKQTDNGFKLPKLGEVKVFNFKRKINGILKTASITKEIDGLYLNITFIPVENKSLSESQGEVGIDMGIKYFLVTSEGEYIDNPKFLENSLKQLRVEQRSLSRKKLRSNNWYKQVEKVKKLHLKVKRCRKDYNHKISAKLSKEYNTVIREDLNIKGMVKNKRLSRHISDVSWGMFFEMLEYKVNEVIKVNPQYTSQECSNCGHISKENRKTQEQFKCVSCDFEMNADEQACLNILKRGQSLLSVNVSQ